MTARSTVTQTVYAIAIVFGLLDEETVRLSGTRLAAFVAESGYHIQTGDSLAPTPCGRSQRHRSHR